MPLGVLPVERQRAPVVFDRLGVAPQVVVDVAEVEVGLEEAVVETERAFVERLRFRQLVARVADVGEVDDRGHQVRVVVQRLAVGARRFLLPVGCAVVEQ